MSESEVYEEIALILCEDGEVDRIIEGGMKRLALATESKNFVKRLSN